MPAFKNKSMMEDERMNERQKTLKKYKTYREKYVDGDYPPIGHVYSVMVEELGIENPDFQGFIDKLNEYIEIGGDGFARIKSKDEYLYSRTAHKFRWYLEREWKGIPESVFNKIIKEAYGGYIY